MKDKCEICGGLEELTEVFVCACDENSPSATLCKDCRKKYFEHNFGRDFRNYPFLSFAENLVANYKRRYATKERKDSLTWFDEVRKSNEQKWRDELKRIIYDALK